MNQRKNRSFNDCNKRRFPKRLERHQLQRNATFHQPTTYQHNFSYPQQGFRQGCRYQQPTGSYHQHPLTCQQPDSREYQQQGYYLQSDLTGHPVPGSWSRPVADYGHHLHQSHHPTIGPRLPIASSQPHHITAVQAGSYLPQYSAYLAMSYPQWNSAQYGQPQYGYQAPPGYDAYGQQQQQPLQYPSNAPQIRNPFAAPMQSRSQFTSQNAEHDPEYEAQLEQWKSAYLSQDQQDKGKKGPTKAGENPNLSEIGVRTGPTQSNNDNHATNKAGQEEKKKTVVRKGGGQSWEDDSLLEWDPTQFRIMVGNLAGEVTDDSLAKAFANYGVAKARVVRDKRTTKSKGYGFVSFTDGELGFKAAREMTGKYIGSHPVTIQRSKTDLRPVMRKEKDKGKHHKNKGHGGKGQDDPLKAHTGAHIEKKPVKNPAYKILG